MAKVIGKEGRYVSDKAAQLRSHGLILGFVMIGLLGLAEGVSMSSMWAKWNPPGWLTTTAQWVGFGAILMLVKWGWHKLDELEAERIKWQRGADGETVVGKILANFPNDFHVINDISTSSGNLDHVVVGPTGVFVLDAKNWRGLVQADGNGELLLNGKRLDKDYARQFIGRIMSV